MLRLRGPRAARRLFWSGCILIGLSLVAALLAPLLSPFDPTQPVALPYQTPSFAHPFGTDKLGFDLFSRVLYGMRVAWVVGLLSSLVSAVVGSPLGVLAGYSGGPLDRLLTTIMDALFSFPGILLAITLLAVLGPGIWSTVVAVFVVFAPQYYRVARNSGLVVKEEPYVEAAHALGASPVRVMSRYIFPNILPGLFPILSGNMASAILVYASLSFLGLGVTPPAPSLGYDLSQSQLYLADGPWWWALFPGLALVLIIAGFSLMAEGLGELASH